MSAPTVNTKLDDDCKILVIFGSPKKDGNTTKLLDSFLNSCPKDTEVKEYNCFENNPKPCVDCGYCIEKQKCCFDDLNEFYEYFENADLVVFATPIYNYSFPSPMKALIDRFQRYYNARFKMNIKLSIEKYRQALILSTSGSQDDFGFKVIEYQLTRAFTVLNIDLVGTVYINNTDKKPINNTNIIEIKQLANSLFK